MNFYFRHLFVELYYHQTQPPWRQIPTVSCHVVYRIHLLFDAVDLELLLYYFVVPLDRALLGSYESAADRLADLDLYTPKRDCVDTSNTKVGDHLGFPRR